MYFLQSIMEEEPSKGPSHNNPAEAAKYVRSVNSLLQSFVTDIHGFNRYKCLDAWETFLHALSQLLSKLDSAYFTKMDTELILDTIPDTCFQWRDTNRSWSYIQNAPTRKFTMFWSEGTTSCHLQDAHNHMAEVAKAVVNVSEVSSPEQFTFVLQLAVRPIIQLKIPPHL